MGGRELFMAKMEKSNSTKTPLLPQRVTVVRALEGREQGGA